MFLPVALILIAGLGSDDFDTRETCQEILSVCPELAEPVLWRYGLATGMNLLPNYIARVPGNTPAIPSPCTVRKS
jgi:hypothetical protein